MAERLTRKQLKQDRFLQGVYQAWAYAQSHVPVVVAGAAAFFVLVILAVKIGTSAAGGGGDPVAERDLAAARSEFLLGRSDAGLAALQDVRARHRGSRAAKEATFLLGSAYYQAGDYASARQTFEEFLRSPLYHGLLDPSARLAIAACREETGDLSGAVSDYLALWNSASHPGLRLQAALGAARCARVQGLLDTAAEIYRGIVDVFPAAPEADDARFQLLQLPGNPSSF